MLYQRFEDLPVYKLANALNDRVMPLLRIVRRNGDYRYADQLRGATISISSNIAEGFERASHREFIQFLVIAKGSCGEVRSLLNQAIREELMEREELIQIRHLALNISRHLSRFINYLRTRPR